MKHLFIVCDEVDIDSSRGKVCLRMRNIENNFLEDLDMQSIRKIIEFHGVEAIVNEIQKMIEG